MKINFFKELGEIVINLENIQNTNEELSQI